jgi:peptide/nickel transport system substrate-binding protein
MRKLAFGSIVLVLMTCGWGTRGLGQQVPVSRGELRIVDREVRNWVWTALQVFEHLAELDQDGTLVPRLATGWRWLDERTLDVTLRQGVTFHNGEGFDAEIVKLNWEENTRLLQPHRQGTMLNFKAGVRLEILDPYRIQFRFPEPDGAALAKLSIMHIANRQFYRDLGWGEIHW